MGRMALTTEGLAKLHDVAAGHVGDTAVPGLVALVAQGEQVHVETLGTLAVGGAPVTRQTRWRIASTSKPLLAAGTLALVGEGLLDLDEPVTRLLPELAGQRVMRAVDAALDDTVPLERPITTRDLLTFTAGSGMQVEMFTADPPWPVIEAAQATMVEIPGPPQPQRTPDPDTYIAAFGALPLMYQPGTRWLYNTSAMVLSVLAARAAGAGLDEVLRTRVFAPLGMDRTAFWTEDTSGLPTLYAPTPDGLVAIDEPDGQWSRRPAFPDGAAGLLSTVDDLHAFARMLLDGGAPVLRADLAREMCTDQLTDAQKAYGPGRVFLEGRSWGFGQSVLPDGSYGWDGGLGSSMLIDPAHDLTMIVLTQRAWDSPVAPQVHTDIQQAAYAALD
jgi:CubicO group peptidase (beta-lactamase class C family)